MLTPTQAKQAGLRLGMGIYGTVARHHLRGFSRNYESDCPLRCITADCYEGQPVYHMSRVCRTAGVALVHVEDTCDYYLLGRESLVDLVKAFLQGKGPGDVDSAAVRRAFNSEWRLPRPPESQREIEECRSRVVGLDRLRHLVVERYPALRARTTPGGPEVEIDCFHEVYRVGGVFDHLLKRV